MALAGTLATATVVGIAVPAALASPQPAGLDLLQAAAAAHAVPAAGPAGRSKALASEPVRVTMPDGKQATGYRIPIPGSETQSGIVALTDRYAARANKGTLSVERGGAEWAKAEAFVRRVEEIVADLASKPGGMKFLEGLSRMQPLDVAVGSAKPATGLADVNVVFHRELSDDPEQWPEDLKNRWKDAKKDDDWRRGKGELKEGEPGDADLMRSELSGAEPMAMAYDREGRARNGIGSQGMVSMSEVESVYFGYLSDGTRVAIKESQLVGHELVHTAHFLQGALLDGKVPVKVSYRASDGSEKTAVIMIPAEEVGTMGGDDARRTLSHVEGAELEQEHYKQSMKAVQKELQGSHPEAVQETLAHVQLARVETFPVTETTLAAERGWPVRDHYANPPELAKELGISVEKLGGDFVKVPPGEKVTDADLRDPEGLQKRLESAGKTKGVVAQVCSRLLKFGRPAVCRPDGDLKEVTEETKKRVGEVEEFLKEHPDAQVKLPSADDSAARNTREKARAAAVTEAETLPGWAREQAKELCAKSGQASCLKEVDWKKVREQAQAKAERGTELKLAGLENVGEARLVKDLDAVMKDPSAFYVPYDKTRAKLGGELFNWGNVVKAGGAVVWVAGVATAFAGESTDLDKAAAINALVPVVGSLLQVGVDVQERDFAGAGLDGFALLMEGLELAGVESAAAGPAFAVAMVYHLAKIVSEIGEQLDESVKRVPDVRDKAWHDALLKYLQDPKEGWLTKGGGTEAVAAGIALVQAAEMQRAAVKGLAHVASTANGSGTVQAAETGSKKWSAPEQFADADAKVDALTSKLPAQMRSSLATSLAKGMNAAWEHESGKKFNQQFIDKVNNANWCPSPDAGGLCAQRVYDLQQEALAKLEKAPPGVTAAEVEDILKSLGMTDAAAPQRDTALAGLLTAQGASGQVDAVVPVPGTDREHWVFSGGQYVRMRLDDTADGEKLPATLTGNNKPAPVKDNWQSLEPLLAASKTGRVDAAMPVPGADRDLYVFSGDQYTRIRLDDDLNDTVPDGYEKPRSLPDNWSSLTDLFAKSGARQVDAVHAVPGNDFEYYVFSGSWFTTVRLDSGLKDEQMVAPRHIADGWPKLVTGTGKDHIQGLVPVPRADRDFYAFTDGGYVKVSAKSLRLPTPSATANAAHDHKKAGIYWSNGEDVPGNAKLVAQERGSRQQHSYPARDGKNEDWTAPTVDLVDVAVGQVPKTTVIDVHYEYTHQDGTVEKSPTTTVRFECWYMVCKGVPQHEG